MKTGHYDAPSDLDYHGYTDDTFFCDCCERDVSKAHRAVHSFLESVCWGCMLDNVHYRNYGGMRGVSARTAELVKKHKAMKPLYITIVHCGSFLDINGRYNDHAVEVDTIHSDGKDITSDHTDDEIHEIEQIILKEIES